MRYVLINHVPVEQGDRPGRVAMGDLFWRDLQAQAQAIAEVGGELVLALPMVQQLDPMSGGSFRKIEVDLDAAGITHMPLPRFQSLRAYLENRSAWNRAVEHAVDGADMVQMDYGGSPYMLGELAWPIAGRAGAKRIWLFDGGDPFSVKSNDIAAMSSPLKRFIARRRLNAARDFCRRAIPEADLVFSHNPNVVDRFRDIWGSHCHRFLRSFVTDDILLSHDELHAAQQRLLTASPLRLTVASRLIRIKATDHVLHAMAMLRKEGIALELQVLGDGQELPAYRKLATELGLNDAVDFAGSVPFGPELFDAWSQSNVMLVPNLTAELSRNVMLAAARGMPMVTYPNPSTDGMLRDADAAIITQDKTAASLAAALRQAHQDRHRLAELAANGLKLAAATTMNATHRRRAELAAATVTQPSSASHAVAVS